MTSLDEGLYAAMSSRGISRRAFLRFASAMTAALALPMSYAPRVAAAVAAAPRVPLVWLSGQACGGDSAAFMHAAKPTTAALMLELLSVDYLATLMAPSGAAAERVRAARVAAGGYIAVVEGSMPTADGGVACAIGGRAYADVAREVTAGALATIAVGSCAFDGGVSAASGGSTGAVGAAAVTGGSRLIALPGCPVNVENLAATIVHYLTFKQLPVVDGRNRPLFAYGGLIHNQCERRAHFEFGEFVLSWGDEAAQKGWCLYKMGCKGPETYANCPTTRYAEGVSWAVKAGHGCVSCTMPGFWDAASPFYSRLPAPLPFAPRVTADQVGLGLVGAVAGATAVHGAASVVRERRKGAAERSEEAAAAPPPIEPLDGPRSDAPADASAVAVASGLADPAADIAAAVDPATADTSLDRARADAAAGPGEPPR